uniref:Uncharacterized protein n=1 Tax=Anopheles atroparvus TaxID=41427 RepID=A0A182J1R4_ANOAO
MSRNPPAGPPPAVRGLAGSRLPLEGELPPSPLPVLLSGSSSLMAMAVVEDTEELPDEGGVLGSSGGDVFRLSCCRCGGIWSDGVDEDDDSEDDDEDEEDDDEDEEDEGVGGASCGFSFRQRHVLVSTTATSTSSTTTAAAAASTVVVMVMVVVVMVVAMVVVVVGVMAAVIIVVVMIARPSPVVVVAVVVERGRRGGGRSMVMMVMPGRWLVIVCRSGRLLLDRRVPLPVASMRPHSGNVLLRAGRDDRRMPRIQRRKNGGKFILFAIDTGSPPGAPFAYE